jgi:hypothetical protein
MLLKASFIILLTIMLFKATFYYIKSNYFMLLKASFIILKLTIYV